MRHLNHNFATLLGGKYADSMMLMYNKESAEQLMQTMKTNTFQWLQYSKLEDTNVPHVYDALSDFLVPSLKDFLADKPGIAELVGDDKEVIIITRNPEKKHVIGYYRDGHIDVGHYMSA